jgi:hypothetical protein
VKEKKKEDRKETGIKSQETRRKRKILGNLSALKTGSFPKKRIENRDNNQENRE